MPERWRPSDAGHGGGGRGRAGEGGGGRGRRQAQGVVERAAAVGRGEAPLVLSVSLVSLVVIPGGQSIVEFLA
jgi:hypothetical protein